MSRIVDKLMMWTPVGYSSDSECLFYAAPATTLCPMAYIIYICLSSSLVFAVMLICIYNIISKKKISLLRYYYTLLAIIYSMWG